MPLLHPPTTRSANTPKLCPVLVSIIPRVTPSARTGIWPSIDVPHLLRARLRTCPGHLSSHLFRPHAHQSPLSCFLDSDSTSRVLSDLSTNPDRYLRAGS